MDRLEGNLARSLAGHDKDQVYVVVETQGHSVWLADGKLRPLEHLKKKNLRHIQPIFLENISESQKKQQEELVSMWKALYDKIRSKINIKNEEIKRVLKLYHSNSSEHSKI